MSDAPRVPPLVVAGGVAAIMGLAAGADVGRFELPGRTWVALAVGALGVAIAGAGVIGFRRAQTTVDPLAPERATRLVVSGVYRWTRNPMYVGFALALLAWGLFLGSWLALLGVPVFVVAMDRWQIPAEERALEERFGEAFREYRRRVRRWV